MGSKYGFAICLPDSYFLKGVRNLAHVAMARARSSLLWEPEPVLELNKGTHYDGGYGRGISVGLDHTDVS